MPREKTTSNNPNKYNQLALVPLLTFSLSLPAEELWDMDLEDLQSVRVTSIATGTETPLDKAAAIVSVISAEDIHRMGARDIAEVLETIPGLHVGRNPIDYTPEYNIRGITSAYTAQTLILINGIPISSLYVGSPSLVWAGMPTKAIEKIEVIRGPGSALYGADAFSGVINIETKGAENIVDGELGVRTGSFRTRDAWLSYGNRDLPIDIGFTLEYTETDGFKEQIDADLQSTFDSLTGTSASLAPGETNTGKQMIDMRLELGQKNWTFRAGYQGRDKVESGAGIAESLSPTGRFSSDRVNTDFTYLFQGLGDSFKLSSRLSYYYQDQQVEKDNVLFPSGTNAFYPLDPLADGPLFPDGMIGNPEYREEQARFHLDGEFSGFENHIIRMGVGYFWGDIYETTEQKNFTAALTPRPGGREEVGDTADIFLPERDRTSNSVYVQDEWLFADNWALTSGVRFDHYSDFGDTTNPRLALIWATTDSVTTKLLYGRAFRAPAFNELYVESNPVNLGDPDLDPEVIDTFELALSQQVTADLRYSANVYYYEVDGIITLNDIGFGAQQWQNSGDRTGRGIEVDVYYKHNDTLRLFANYAYQKSKDDESNEDVGETPNHQLYLRSEWDFGKKWLISTQVNWVGKQRRGPTDPRTESVPHYTTVDLLIRQYNVLDKLDISLTAKNLFDRSVFEASPSPGNIPNDFPMAGRSLYAELSYKF